MNYVISIINPDALEALTEICEKLSLPLTVTLHGRGTAMQGMLDLLGIESNEKRVVLTAANEEKTAQLIAAQRRYLHLGVPGHGFVIAIPIKSVGGGRAVAYMNGDTKNAKYTPAINYDYELIVAISNEGSTDLVMNAARAAGARGGTVLHGKGTDEKEVILIVSTAEQKSGIMRAILEKAGPDSKAGSIVFSLPTTEVAGFGVFDSAEV